MRARTTLLAGACLISMGVSAAHAQEQTPTQGTTNRAPGDETQSSTGQPQPVADAVPQGEGDIIVTARRRAETLQDVPVAISAVSGDLIEQRGLTSVRE